MRSFFEYDGFTLAYQEFGSPDVSARPIVLLHGLLLSSKHNIPLAKALVERGNRVILLDLLGHGESDKPRHSRYHSMELYAKQVVGLLDHLAIQEAVVGGTSLGANVALEVAWQAPDRVTALFVEMPVLERAAPAAAAIFLPLVIAYAEASNFLTHAGRFFARLPRPTLYAGVVLDALSREPVSSAAVLHGLLVGRLAPHPSDREKIDHRALIIGHGQDILHPFTDADALRRELRNSQLIRANSFFELRFPPNRLSNAIGDFLDEVWG
jgi:pimeloyl-ACP methyl ester carboxylesterase